MCIRDRSTGHIRTWTWAFGDGASDTEQNTSHEYTAGGTYTVALTVQGAGGSNTLTKTNFIQVYDLVTAAFTATPTSGYDLVAVQFTDQSIGSVSQWQWDFGDGATSTSQSPAHTYDTEGAYTVTLTVQGPGNSDTETKQNYIHVYNASFTASPSSGEVPLEVQFNDTSTGPTDVWEWDFGDGITSTAQHPTHTYGTTGTFNVSLAVQIPDGTPDTDTASGTVQVNEEGAMMVVELVEAAPDLKSENEPVIQVRDGAQYTVYLPAAFNERAAVEHTSDPVVRFDRVIDDYGIDLDGDGRFDQLVFDIRVEAMQAGDYWIRGALAGGFAEATGKVHLEKGRNTVAFPFNGTTLYMHKVDGPYVLESLWATDVENPAPADFIESALDFVQPAYTTSAYTFFDFGVAGAILSGDYDHHTVDTDGDGYADALVVETGLDIVVKGIYTVRGVLYTGQSGEVPVRATWTGSESRVTLRFDGLRGTVGPYILQYLHVRNAADQVTDGIKEPVTLGQAPELSAKPLQLGVQTTELVKPSDLRPAFVITNTGYSDTGVDTDGDGKFDRLDITIDVEVEAGEGGTAYRIEGWLVDANNSPIAWAISAPQVLTLSLIHI